MSAVTFEKWVIRAVSFHSLVLGFAMLANPVWTMGLFGWEYEGSDAWELFYPRQSGVFLLILGIAYLEAERRDAFVWLIIGSKTVAVIFLVWQYIEAAGPALLILAAVGDGAMGGLVAFAMAWRTREGLRKGTPDRRTQDRRREN